MTDFSNIDTAVVGVGLIDGSLSHWSNEPRNLKLVKQIMCFLDHAVPDAAGVRHDDRILCLVQQIQNCRENLAFSCWIILRQTQVDLLLQSLVYRSVKL